MTGHRITLPAKTSIKGGKIKLPVSFRAGIKKRNAAKKVKVVRRKP